MLSLASDLFETDSTSVKGTIDKADGRFDGSNPFGRVRRGCCSIWWVGGRGGGGGEKY